jgi:peroxiredoxin
MRNKRGLSSSLLVMLFVFFFSSAIAYSASEQFKGKIYDPGMLKPVDSRTKMKAGMPAPSFTLPSLTGEKISLAHYRGKKNVVLSFVPAAWTPVCSDQWPGYNILKDVFDKNDAVLLGITVDNLPTLNAWTKEMGDLWFPVLSDFWPHGAVSKKYGVLRSIGVSERALFIIDKKGIIRYFDVHDINKRPPLEVLVRELEKLNK